MKRAKHGYLIVLKPNVFGERFGKRAVSAYRAYAGEGMWRAFAAFALENYRGTGRFPLEAGSRHVVELFEAAGGDVQGNKAARARFDEIIDWSEEDPDNNLFERLADAREVFGLLECPPQWEIIEVRRHDFAVGPATLGFDVACWSGHYSFIADTLVAPEWHPPAPGDCAEVAQEFSSLNQHLLFPRPEDAARFLAYYKSKSWAETEGREGDFCLIQVDQVPESPSD